MFPWGKNWVKCVMCIYLVFPDFNEENKCSHFKRLSLVLNIYYIYHKTAFIVFLKGAMYMLNMAKWELNHDGRTWKGEIKMMRNTSFGYWNYFRQVFIHLLVLSAVGFYCNYEVNPVCTWRCYFVFHLTQHRRREILVHCESLCSWNSESGI